MSILKVYVAYKSEEKEMPHLICDGIDVTESSGLSYYDDEVGWYYIHGELECDDK